MTDIAGDFWIWAVPLALYALGFAHHAWAWRKHEQTMLIESRQQKRLEMFREVMALVRYGAREEAEQLLDEAIALGEDIP